MTQKRKFGKQKGVKAASYIFVYALLILSVYWGTILSVFSISRFVNEAGFGTPSIFLLVFAALGLVAWINAIWYVKVFKDRSPAVLFVRFFQQNKPPVLFAAAATALWGLLFFSQSVFTLPSSVLSALHTLSLPWVIGETLMFTVHRGTLKFIPALAPINELGFLVGLLFELTAFYYIGKGLYWVQRKLQS